MPLLKTGTFDLEHGPLALALLPLVVLPQAVGGVHPSVAVGAAVVELAALVWFVLRGARSGKRLLVPWTVAPFALGLLFTLVQIAPWPRGVVRFLSPAGFERVTWMTALLPDDVRASVWPRLTLDPPESAFAAVRLLGAVLLFFVVADAARHRQARAWVYRVLLVSGAAVFVVALGHRLLNVQGAWGLFTMKSAPFYAPLVNPNQLGRIFGAFALVLLGRAFEVRSRTEALWCGGTALLCGAGVFLTLSRGAMLAFGVGGVLLLALLARERFFRADDDAPAVSRVALTVAPMVLLLSLAVGLFIARESVLKEVGTLGTQSLEQSKIALYAPALSLLDAYATTGVGNNAFGVAFTERATADLFGGNLTFTHVENIAVGTLVEHGIFAGSVLCGLVLVLGFLLLHRLRTRAQFAALPALVFLVVSDLFDFVLESTAGLYLAATLLALCTARALDDSTIRRASPRAAFIALGVAASLLAMLALSAVGAWRPTLDAALVAAHGDARQDALDRATAAHPADGHYAYLQAVAARERNDAALALRWANRALVAWPWHAGAHVEAARALVAAGRLEQALLEYRAAWLSHGNKTKLLDEVALRTSDVTLRRTALPETAGALGELAWRLKGEGRTHDAIALIDDALVLIDAGAGEPTSIPSLRLEAARLSLAVGDPTGAEARLAPLVAVPNPRGDVLVAHLQAREALVGAERAYGESRAFVKASAAGTDVLGWQLDAAARLGRFDEAIKLLEELKRRAGSGASIEWLERKEASLHARSGDRGRQLRILERLAQRNGADLGLQLEVAELQLALGLATQARASWARAARIAPTQAEVITLEQRIRELEMKKALEGPLGR